MAENKGIEAGLEALSGNITGLIGRMGVFGQALNAGATGLNKLSAAAEKNVDVWQRLSNTGAGFSNDLVRMSTAAINSRMGLEEFGKLISSNANVLGGLGGNVTRGAEAFARMSKDFQDGADNLRLLGYTNKELNDVLALTITSSRHIQRDDEARSRFATKAAKELAEEMDAMARLTGKSREEQMDMMKKQQTDMQLDAAIRLKAMKIADPIERAQYEDNIKKQLLQAEREGRGQMAKEMFVFGTTVSKEASVQATMMQGQARATQQAMAAASDLNLKQADRERLANEYQNKARAESLKDANNTALLEMRTLGNLGGVASDSLNKVAGVQNTYYQSLEAVAKQHGLNLENENDRVKAVKIANEEAKKAASGINKQGEQADASSRALVLMGSAAKSVTSGLATIAEKSINKEIIPELSKAANKIAALSISPSGDRVGIAPRLEQGAEAARMAGAAGDKLEAPSKSVVTKRKDAGGLEGVGAGAAGAADVLAKLGAITIGTVTSVVFQNELPKRQTGSIGMTGKAFEEWGAGTLVELHGKEGVFTPDDIANMAKGMQSKGAEAAFKNLGTSIMKNVPAVPSNNIDITKMFGSLGPMTTVSSASREKEVNRQVDEAIARATKSKMSNEMATMGTILSKNAAISAAMDQKKILEGSVINELPKNLGDDLFRNMPKGLGPVMDGIPKNLGADMFKNMPKELGPIIDGIPKNLGDDLFRNMPKGLGGIIDGIPKNLGDDLFRNMPKGLGGIMDEIPKKISSGKSPLSFEDMVHTTFPTAKASIGKIEQPEVKTTKQVQQATQTIKSPDVVEQQAKKTAPEAKPAATPTAEPKPQEKPPAPGGKEATLNDVVASINQLNNSVSRLMQQQESGMTGQTKALRQIASMGNGFFN